MVDQRCIVSYRVISKLFKHLLNLGFDFIVVLDVVKTDIAFFYQTEFESMVQIGDELIADNTSVCSVRTTTEPADRCSPCHRQLGLS